MRSSELVWWYWSSARIIDNFDAKGRESLPVDLDIFEGVEMESELYLGFIAHYLNIIILSVCFCLEVNKFTH